MPTVAEYTVDYEQRNHRPIIGSHIQYFSCLVFYLIDGYMNRFKCIM